MQTISKSMQSSVTRRESKPRNKLNADDDRAAFMAVNVWLCDWWSWKSMSLLLIAFPRRSVTKTDACDLGDWCVCSLFICLVNARAIVDVAFDEQTNECGNKKKHNFAVVSKEIKVCECSEFHCGRWLRFVVFVFQFFFLFIIWLLSKSMWHAAPTVYACIESERHLNVCKQ